MKNGKHIITGPAMVYAIPHLKEYEVIDYIPQEQTGKFLGFTSEPLKDWRFESESIEQTDKGVSITVRGKYEENPIELVYSFDNNNRLRIDYILNIFKIGNSIRQIGIGSTFLTSIIRCIGNENHYGVSIRMTISVAPKERQKPFIQKLNPIISAKERYLYTVLIKTEINTAQMISDRQSKIS